MPFIFNNNYIKAFKKLKDWLISSSNFYYYNLNFKLMLEIDVFNRVVTNFFFIATPK